MFIVSDKKSASSIKKGLLQECKMLLPIKFIAANIFVSGIVVGSVCGAVAVSTLLNPERRNRMKDHIKACCGDRKK